MTKRPIPPEWHNIHHTAPSSPDHATKFWRSNHSQPATERWKWAWLRLQKQGNFSMNNNQIISFKQSLTTYFCPLASAVIHDQRQRRSWRCHHTPPQASWPPTQRNVDWSQRKGPKPPLGFQKNLNNKIKLTGMLSAADPQTPSTTTLMPTLPRMHFGKQFTFACFCSLQSWWSRPR